MTTAQVDLFSFIHKAIRAMLFDLADRLQSTDLSDESVAPGLVADMRRMLVLLHAHAEHEDRLIFPAIEAVAPGSTQEAGEEHQLYENKTARLEGLLGQLESSSSPDDRKHSDHELRLAFFDFLAFTLVHLNHEEETALPASQRYLADDQLLAIRAQIQQASPPDQYEQWMRWMLPALTTAELKLLFGQARQGAPAAVFEKMLEMGKRYLPTGRWAIVSSG